MTRDFTRLAHDLGASVRSSLGIRVAGVFDSCFRNTLSTTITDLPDGTTFLVTGDIPAMWLRDSTAQLTPYLHFAAEEPGIAELVTRVSRRQLRYIEVDPYANAFNAEPNGRGHRSDLTDLDPWVWERKYEVDSLAYPVQLAYDLWRITGGTAHLDGFAAAARTVIGVWRTEQAHDRRSPYRFQRLDGAPSDTLARDGLGPRTAEVGLTWSGFRPSDDANALGYNVPANAFAVTELAHIEQLARQVLGDESLAEEARSLGAEIDAAIREHGVVSLERFGELLAYEVDGAGQYLMMDDANVPSLLSLPLLGWCAADDPLYLATRDFVLSDANPQYFSGDAARGVGSPHTPSGNIWPIALAVQGLTTTDPAEALRLVETLVATDAGTRLMHESFDRDDPARFTRPWFSWANAMFCELVLEVCGLRSYRRALARSGAA